MNTATGEGKTASAEQRTANARLLADNIGIVGAEHIIVLCGTAIRQGREPFLEKGAVLIAGR